MSEPYRVVIADDEKQVRERLIYSFPWERLGLKVSGAACDGYEALQLIERFAPQFVLTDIRMPGMGGLELANTVKERFPAVKVVILSAYDDFKYAQVAIRAGAKGYLMKPLSRDDFIELFHRLVQEFGQERSGSAERERALIALLKGEVPEKPYVREAVVGGIPIIGT